jgi:hypothetical protein
MKCDKKFFRHRGKSQKREIYENQEKSNHKNII